MGLKDAPCRFVRRFPAQEAGRICEPLQGNGSMLLPRQAPRACFSGKVRMPPRTSPPRGSHGPSNAIARPLTGDGRDSLRQVSGRDQAA